MSRLVKAVISGVVIATIGLIIMIAVLGINGWKLDNSLEDKMFECTTDISTININFDIGTLNTEYYDGDKIKIEYQQSKRLEVDIDETSVSGELHIKTNSKFKFFGINYWFYKSPVMKIKIPKNYVVDLKGNINAGIANFASGNYGVIDMNMNAGVMNFENIKCDNFKFILNAGKIKIQNIETGTAYYKVNAGDLKIAKMLCDNFDINLNAGNTLINELSSDKFTAKINAGTLNLEKMICDNIYLNVNAGNFKTKIVGVKEDYTVLVKNDSGNCNIKSQTGRGENKLIDIDIDAGSINVYFTEN